MRAGDHAAHLFGAVLFGILYYVALGPMALIVKASGRKLLPRFTGDESTYYLPKEPIPPTLDRAKKQW